MGLSFMLCPAVPSAIAGAPGPAISGEGKWDCDALNKKEQIFHTHSTSLCNAEEQVCVYTWFCSWGRPFTLIPQFWGVFVYCLCEQWHKLPRFSSTWCSSACRLALGQNKYITVLSVTSIHPAMLTATEM